MLHTFRYGNIFTKNVIKPAIELEPVLQIKEGQSVNALTIGDLIKNKEKAIRRVLKSRVTTATIIYAEGWVYFDVFIDVGGQRINKFRSNKRLPIKIATLYEEYQNLIFDSINRGVSLAEDRENGYTLSENIEVRKYEEAFLILVPRYIDMIIEVLRSSRFPMQRQIAAYILQWQPNKKLAAKELFFALRRELHHGVHNTIVRALIIIAHKIQMGNVEANKVYGLLYHPSSACINKCLALLWQISSSKRLSIPPQHVDRIVLLKEVRQPIIRDYALKLVDKIKEGCRR